MALDLKIYSSQNFYDILEENVQVTIRAETWL